MREERKRLAGMNDQRRQCCRHLRVEIVAGFAPLSLGQLLPVPQVNAMPRQIRHELLHHITRLLPEERLESLANLLNQPLPLRGQVFTKPSDALHEELVEIGAEDGEKL